MAVPPRSSPEQHDRNYSLLASAVVDNQGFGRLNVTTPSFGAIQPDRVRVLQNPHECASLPKHPTEQLKCYCNTRTQGIHVSSAHVGSGPAGQRLRDPRHTASTIVLCRQIMACFRFLRETCLLLRSQGARKGHATRRIRQKKLAGSWRSTACRGRSFCIPCDVT